MITEILSNPVIEIVIKLVTMIAIFIPIAIAATEGIKSLFELKGRLIQITAIIVNVIFGVMIVVQYLNPQAGKYVAIVIFMIIVCVAPLGGYDILMKFTKTKNG